MRREYDELLAFVAFYWTHVVGMDPENPAHVGNVAPAMLEKCSLRMALAGMRQAANDTVQGILENMTATERADMDTAMQRQGLTPLSVFLRERAKRYGAILKRRSIRTQTEFYLAKSVLEDGAVAMDTAERELLEELVGKYEQSLAGRRRPKP
jgi:hypothetical protein